MNEGEQQAKGSVVPYVVLALLCGALAMVGTMLKTRAEDGLRDLKTSEKEYFNMVQMRKDVESQDKTDIPDIEVRDGRWDDFQAYMSSVRDQVGIRSSQMSFKYSASSSVIDRAWRPHGIIVDLSGSRQDPIPFGALVQFLDKVEREKRFMKTTNFNLRLTEGRKVNGTQVKMEYYLPKEE